LKDIETICHGIYDDYGNYRYKLEEVRNALIMKMENLPDVNLYKSRIKELDSLLCKVIEKRYAHMMDENNLYAGISGDNYKDILTDLIGIRLIISYRGKWRRLHDAIIKEFPYANDMRLYENSMFIPHPSDGSNCLAEIPKAYHAYGDDLSVYDGLKIDTKLKENGYRSVHYIVSFMGVYIEIQTRTIYDEAWNDCDHNYVYKKETHVSHSALSELSSALSMLTNASNDLGEKMQYIYEKEVIREKEGKYVSQDADLNFNDIFDKINNACHLLETFNSHFN
jgi:GTP pyrophosphokinase